MEGCKSVEELLRSPFDVRWVAADEVALARWRAQNLRLPAETVAATRDQLADAGSYQTNDGAVAIAAMKPARLPEAPDGITLVLDDIRDPGNLGTLIRTADWYGVTTIVASATTADFYSPKTIQASMGSFTRVSVYYTELALFLAAQRVPVYGTFLEGENVQTFRPASRCMVVIGNEANGISDAVACTVTTRITIPRFGAAESLNAAIAAAVVLDNFKRLQ